MGEDAGVRPLGVLLRCGRGRLRDRGRLRQSGHVPDRPVDPALDRNRDRGHGFARRHGVRRAVRRVHPDQLGAEPRPPLHHRHDGAREPQRARLAARDLRHRAAARALRRPLGSGRASCAASSASAGARLLFRRRATYSRRRRSPQVSSPKGAPDEENCSARRRSVRRGGSGGRHGRRDTDRNAGRHRPDNPSRGNLPAQRAGLWLRTDSRGDEGVLLVRERPARRQRPPDRLQVRRRRIQPREHRPADPQVRRAGSRVRAGRRARHGAAAGGRGVPEPAEGAAALRLDGGHHLRPRLREVPVDDRLAAGLRGRGRDLRQVHRARICRARSSASSTRTTITAATT